ncbi:hypothetical protein ACQBAT_14030 [Ornithinimicrobium sp. Y1847]|uniref:hypothetical protein n=1 Tax=Ornithinimicrobium sp. Y1847 TaxID=3405419 RepID=UPI003B66D011
MRDAWPDLASDARNPGRSPKQQIRWYAVAAAARAVTFVQRRAALVVTTTDSFTEVLRRRGMEKVATVRNAHHPVPGVGSVDEVATVSASALNGSTGTLAPDADNAPAHPGELHIVYVGTAGRAQDLTTSVRALARVRAAGIDARLRIVGTGARLVLLAPLAEELGVPLEILGAQPRDRS